MADLVQRFAHGREVIIQPCPGLVEQVERHALQSPETIRLLQTYLAPIVAHGADTLVLGCTHYPFLLPAINRLLDAKVKVIDTAPAIANAIYDAVGVSIKDLPITPEKILRALKEKEDTEEFGKK